MPLNQITESADLHNVASGSTSFLDTATNFAVASIVSGAHSFYNTGVDILNLFQSEGDKIERANTYETLQSYDSSLGSYYLENKNIADLGGLVLGSIIPGTIVTKGVNAGSRALAAAKAGRFGLSMETATGIAPTLSESLYATAAKKIYDGTVTSRINATAMAGVAAGFGEQALMVAGTEALVAATMEANPLLETMTFTDHVKNSAVGAAFFVPIFVGLGAARGFKQMKSAATLGDIESNPYRHIPAIEKTDTPDQALFKLLNKKLDFPEVPTEGISEARQGYLTRLSKETNTALDTKILEQLQKLTGKDTELSLQLKDLILSGTLDDANSLIPFLREIRRGSEYLTVDRKVSSLLQKTYSKGRPTQLYFTEEGKVFSSLSDAALAGEEAGNIRTGEFLNLPIARSDTVKSAKELVEEGYVGKYNAKGDKSVTLFPGADISPYAKDVQFAAAYEESNFSRKFLNLETGSVSTERPPILRFADTLRPGDVITTNSTKVSVGREQFTQIKLGTAFDSVGADLKAVQSRYIFAAKAPALRTGALIHESDIPFLEKAYFQKLENWGLVDAGGNVTQGPTGQSLLSLIDRVKGEAANRLLTSKKVTAEISERVNVPIEVLEGRTLHQEYDKNLFMHQYAKLPITSPGYVQLGYDTGAIPLVGAQVGAGASMQGIFEATKSYFKNVSANFFGKHISDFPELDVYKDIMSGVSRYSGGQGFLGFAQGEYFSFESKLEYIGRLTANAEKRAREAVSESLATPSLSLAQNQAAAVEYSVFLNRARSTGDSYVRTGPMTYELKSSVLHRQAVEKGKSPGPYVPPTPNSRYDLPVTLTLKNPEADDMIKALISETSKRVSAENAYRAARGKAPYSMIEGEFYPHPIDFRSYPHFALVKDTVTGDMSVIVGHTADELKATAAQIPPEFQVLYKDTTSNWHKAIGDFEFSRTIHSNAVDSELRRRGVLNLANPATDPDKLVNEAVNWYKGSAERQVKNHVRLLYSDSIGTLEEMSAQYLEQQTSVAAKGARIVTENVDDPYGDAIRTLLNISKAADYRTWMNPQNTVDAWVSAGIGKAQQLLASARATPEDLMAANAQLAQSGYRGPLYGAEDYILANHTAPKNVLRQVVASMNTLATNLMLKLDFMQSLNNAVGTNILLSSEMTYLTRKLKERAGSAEELSRLMEVQVPGSELTLKSPAKLIARQYGKFFSDVTSKDQPLITRYTELGLLPSQTSQLREALDSMALRMTEDEKSISRFLNVKTLLDKGELLTGNKHSEMMGRFVAAGIADDISDLAIKAGLITEDEGLALINSMVNKVHGNTLASQRPVVFQGFAGQAISLFQTYQFNLMQQLLKYVSDSDVRTTITLLGMQTAIYGVNGFPEFQAINKHVIGSASGNLGHNDLYTATYDAIGKTAGDWLLYGAASNITGTNLYSRGDIQPRNVTVLPVTAADIPFVSLSAKFVSNTFDSLNKVVNGAPVGATFLQGLEHAGFNRPLAGLAQVMQGYSTTSKGSLISVGADWDFVSKMSRLAGARPLDEAILLDANYRYVAYHAKDTDRMNSLGAAVKTKMLSGQEITSSDMDGFLTSYMKAGGRQETFAKQMMNWQKDSTRSTINQVADRLQSGASKYLQKIMAGSQGLPDFTNEGEFKK